MMPATILPESAIFQYTHHPTYAGFANFFRYKLLLERGGWWVDTDAVCLRPFDFPEEYVFSSELTAEGKTTPNNGFIKAPAGSEAMAFAWEVCRAKDTSQITWGETGPRLMSQAIQKYGLDPFLQDYPTFTPIAHFDWEQVLEPGWQGDVFPPRRAAFISGTRWRRAGRDKDAQYPPDCLYERLKALYL